MARSTEAPSDNPPAGNPPAGNPPAGNPPAGALASRRSTSRRHPAVLSAWLMGARWRHAARWLGLAIFLSGAVLLYYVFMEAWHGFQRFQESGYLAESFKNVPAGDVAANVRAVIILFSA
ncbi:MAG TPA: hypothetical protein VNA16_08860, partial [Abditibacteriaceae bacterium]|nr:hypothetical protein [Abditibacteriaceae bacterium]